MDLEENLSSLQCELVKGAVSEVLERDPLEFAVWGKVLKPSKSTSVSSDDACFDTEKINSLQFDQANGGTAKFRSVGLFAVETHIISALWLLTVGDRLDKLLSENAKGSRINRLPKKGSDSAGDIHAESLGTFEPYFLPYSEWRDRGLAAMRDEIEKGGRVTAITTDLTDFYQTVDPSYITSGEFRERYGLTYSRVETDLNRALISLMRRWNTKISEELNFEKVDPIGVPVGLMASKVLANVALIELDEIFETSIRPYYYGRYVDDIFIVFRSDGIDSLEGFWALLEQNSASIKKGAEKVKISISYHRPEFKIVDSKTKLFKLKGRAGRDTIDKIDDEIRSISSERRLLPSVDDLIEGRSSEALVLGDAPNSEPTSLMRAGGLTVKRLAWALKLRNIEYLNRLLPPDQWERERTNFFEFARVHLLNPNAILEHVDSIYRMFGVAVACRDWREAEKLLKTVLESFKAISHNKFISTKVDGFSCDHEAWLALEGTFLKALADAALKNIGFGNLCRTRSDQRSMQNVLMTAGLPLGEEELRRRFLSIYTSDWSTIPLKSRYPLTAMAAHVGRQMGRLSFDDVWDYDRRSFELGLFCIEASMSPYFREFIREPLEAEEALISKCVNSLRYPTRPFSPGEIYGLLPTTCGWTESRDGRPVWAKLVRLLRGSWVSDENLLSVSEAPMSGGSGPTRQMINREEKVVRLGISSYKTAGADWRLMAAGQPLVTAKRHKQISTMINMAIKADPKPTHLILPELALPHEWLSDVAAVLARSNISLISGVEYYHYPHRKVGSSAFMNLRSDDLGWPIWLSLFQHKSIPSPREGDELEKVYNLAWECPSLRKPIYVHGEFAFGTLICSELQNLSYRKNAQGNVDCLIVLSWNQDLATFSSLTEGAALDVHSYIAVVNNRAYGDSRVRAPAMKNFERDICRVKGGENDHMLVVELNPYDLRRFQSRYTRLTDPMDKFKARPEDFEIANYRRVIP